MDPMETKKKQSAAVRGEMRRRQKEEEKDAKERKGTGSDEAAG